MSHCLDHEQQTLETEPDIPAHGRVATVLIVRRQAGSSLSLSYPAPGNDHTVTAHWTGIS